MDYMVIRKDKHKRRNRASPFFFTLRPYFATKPYGRESNIILTKNHVDGTAIIIEIRMDLKYSFEIDTIISLRYAPNIFLTAISLDC